MREVQKHAQSKSIWMNLVRHSVLLYGRRSLLYVQETGNRRRAVEMDLSTQSGWTTSCESSASRG
jgi:hypothetical protein